MTPERLFNSFIPPKTFIPPKQISGYAPGVYVTSAHVTLPGQPRDTGERLPGKGMDIPYLYRTDIYQSLSACLSQLTTWYCIKTNIYSQLESPKTAFDTVMCLTQIR